MDFVREKTSTNLMVRDYQYARIKTWYYDYLKQQNRKPIFLLYKRYVTWLLNDI